MTHCNAQQESQSGVDDTDTIAINGCLTNGLLGSTSPELLPLTPEASPDHTPDVSPESTLEKPPRHAHSMDDLDSRCEEVRRSLSPTLPRTGSVLTPGRKSMEALKKARKIIIHRLKMVTLS